MENKDLCLVSNENIVATWEEATTDQRREALMSGQDKVLEMIAADPTIEAPKEEVEELWCTGMYARTLPMAKGTLLFGSIFKIKCINLLTKGKVLVLADTGVMHLEAPFNFVSPAWTKRAFLVLEDAQWTTVHRTDTTCWEDAKAEYVADTYNELEVGS